MSKRAECSSVLTSSLADDELRARQNESLLAVGAALLKIADFGLAKLANAATRSETFKGWGTRPYQAPEAFDDGPNTPAMGIYAAGVPVLRGGHAGPSHSPSAGTSRSSGVAGFAPSHSAYRQSVSPSRPSPGSRPADRADDPEASGKATPVMGGGHRSAVCRSACTRRRRRRRSHK